MFFRWFSSTDSRIRFWISNREKLISSRKSSKLWRSWTGTIMEIFFFFARQVHKWSFESILWNILNLDFSPRQTKLHGLRPTIEWINREGYHNVINVFNSNLNIYLVDKCNRKFGYESPKVIIKVISWKHISYAVKCDYVIFSHGWPFRRSPRREDCTRKLELGERRERTGIMSLTCIGRCMRDSFSSFLKVTLHNCIHILTRFIKICLWLRSLP